MSSSVQQNRQSLPIPELNCHVGLVPSKQLMRLSFHLLHRSGFSGSAYLPGFVNPATCCPSVQHSFLFSSCITQRLSIFERWAWRDTVTASGCQGTPCTLPWLGLWQSQEESNGRWLRNNYHPNPLQSLKNTLDSESPCKMHSPLMLSEFLSEDIFWLSQLGRWCYWYLVGTVGQRCC